MAGNDALAYLASLPVPEPTMTHACLCGRRRYPNAAAAREAEPWGAYKCPDCRTFATDHECRCDDFSDYRCWDCDIRHGSHGKPPSAPRCSMSGHAAKGCAKADPNDRYHMALCAHGIGFSRVPGPDAAEIAREARTFDERFGGGLR